MKCLYRSYGFRFFLKTVDLYAKNDDDTVENKKATCVLVTKPTFHSYTCSTDPGSKQCSSSDWVERISICLHLDVYKPTSVKLGMNDYRYPWLWFDTSLTILVFTHAHSCTGKQNLLCLFCHKFFWLIWVKFCKIVRPIGFLKLILDLFCSISIQRRGLFIKCLNLFCSISIQRRGLFVKWFLLKKMCFSVSLCLAFILLWTYDISCKLGVILVTHHRTEQFGIILNDHDSFRIEGSWPCLGSQG